MRSVPHITDIVSKITKRSCVLFLGAAVHAPPPRYRDDCWPAQERPPVGVALAGKLAARSGFAGRHPGENATDLMRVALDYEIQMKRGGLVDAVRDEVQQGKRGSPLLKALAQLDFPVVITTNFDTHFEDALYAAGKRPFVCVYRNNLEATELTEDYPSLYPSPAEPFVVKIHGDIKRSSGSIVITEEDYIQFVLRMSDKGPYDPVPEVARAYLAKCATLFLGYSLRDYNLRLLFRTLRWRISAAPPTYSVDFRPDAMVQEVLERRTGQVSYIVEDVWEFVPALVEAVQSGGTSASQS
jgi:hypothetical protein